MKISTHIRKIVGVLLWLIVGAGILVLLLAAMKSKSEMHCSGLNIEINGSASGVWFIDKKDIAEMIGNNDLPVKGRKIQEFDLQKLENRIEKELWVLDAELFFDNNNVLQVEVIERQPISRIFTSQGSSFYIDSALVKLPLSEKMSAKLPVFTGFPSELTRRSKGDSALLSEIKALSSYIHRHPFWMAQITQVHINAKREFELVPMIGNHVIEFGSSLQLEEKFRRLMVFYKQIFTRTGMERYSSLKLQYDGQLVAVRNPRYVNKADSVLALKTVEKLIASTYDEPAIIDDDSLTVSKPVVAPVQPKANPISTQQRAAENPRQNSNPLKANPKNSVKPTTQQRQVPKAVMPKRD